MFCTKCGNEVNSNAAFCVKCGAQINKAKIQQSGTGNVRLDVMSGISTESEFKKNIILGVMVLISTILSFCNMIGDADYIEGTYGEIVDLVKSVTYWFGESGASTVISLGLGCLRFGTIILIIAVVLAFIMPKYKQIAILAGSGLNVVSMLILIFSASGLFAEFDYSFFETIGVFSIWVWVLVVVNGALLGITIKEMLKK